MNLLLYKQDFLFLERIYKDCLKHLSASTTEKVTEKLVNNVCIDNQWHKNYFRITCHSIQPKM